VRTPGCLLCAVVLLCLPAATTVRVQSKGDGQQPMESLSFFVGSWHCDGKFAGSGKAISANIVFEPIPGGKFLLFRHDDEPPFNHHAWSEWGWDTKAHGFISTTQDVTGGLRLFRSPGWADQNLVWTGGSRPDSSDQRFVFERLDNRSFRVSYTLRKNDAWLPVDSSLCTRAGIN
jgi:hypothetical protein